MLIEYAGRYHLSPKTRYNLHAWKVDSSSFFSQIFLSKLEDQSQCLVGFKPPFLPNNVILFCIHVYTSIFQRVLFEP